MSLTQKLIRNIASNWIGYAVQIAVAFFLTPYVLRSLGETRYGIWTLAVGLTGYYGLLDLGFSAGLTHYLTRYMATGDTENLNRTASTGTFVLSFCGACVCLCSLAVAFNAARIFQIKMPASEVAIILAITGFSVGI